MVEYYNAGSSRYINFNSAGQLWNRIPDQSFPNRTSIVPPNPPPFPLNGLWREIVLQFENPQEILLTHLTFKDVKYSQNKEIQLLSAQNGIFVSNNFGNTWITADNLGYGTVDNSAISESGETIILHRPSALDSGWLYSNNAGQTWIQGAELEPFKFVANSNTYYFGVLDFAMNYSGNTIYSIIDTRETDYQGNSFPTFTGNKIAKTEDYGNTWTTLDVFDSTLPTDKIVCSDDGNYIYSLTSFGNSESLVISRDGGVTANIEPVVNNTIPITDIACSSDGSVVVCTISHIESSQPILELNNKLIYISRDYGVTWNITGLTNSQDIIYNTSNLFDYSWQRVSLSRNGSVIAVVAKKQVVNEPYVIFVSGDAGATWYEVSTNDIIPNEQAKISRVYVTPDGTELVVLLTGDLYYINPYTYSLVDKTWYFADFYVD